MIKIPLEKGSDKQSSFLVSSYYVCFFFSFSIFFFLNSENNVKRQAAKNIPNPWSRAKCNVHRIFKDHLHCIIHTCLLCKYMLVNFLSLFPAEWFSSLQKLNLLFNKLYFSILQLSLLPLEKLQYCLDYFATTLQWHKKLAFTLGPNLIF